MGFFDEIVAAAAAMLVLMMPTVVVKDETLLLPHVLRSFLDSYRWKSSTSEAGDGACSGRSTRLAAVCSSMEWSLIGVKYIMKRGSVAAWHIRGCSVL